eukprot:GAHX01001131.1.p2 GENE.GAHX01001131.1~~GAHX01001131.1.p2  ORF type:complete len:547 (-),score=127.77 GAHX01001131.1:2192-3832(-)
MMNNQMIDQYGRPIIVIDALSPPPEPKGTKVLENNIASISELASFITTSFGPNGKDKLIVDEDREITLTNDGATILSKVGLKSPIGRLILGLSVAQDLRSGDGTTGIVLLCSALLNSALSLVKKGVNPARLEKIYGECSDVCAEVIKSCSFENEIDEETIRKTIKCTLNTKIAKHSSAIETLTDVAFSTAESGVIGELLKIEKRISRSATSAAVLIKGLMLEKEFYNPSMKKKLENPKILILSSPIEPPKPKTKHILKITSSEDFKAASDYEENYFVETVNKIKEAGVSLVLCQWGFDEEAGYLLTKHGISAVTWVGGKELEMLSMSTGAEIISSMNDIVNARLGTCSMVEEVSLMDLNESHLGVQDISLATAEQDDKVLLIKDCPENKAFTIMLTAGSQTVLDEIHRSFDDALGVAKTLIGENKKNVLCGGGAVEVEIAKVIKGKAENKDGVEKEVMLGFVKALYEIPRRIARNAELNEERELQNIIRLNQTEDKSIYGVDGDNTGNNDMNEKGVLEPEESKTSQIMMAIDIARMILRIDDVIIN